ncbi:hypothetical protein [Variovorax ginsengisoli]|uniref:DNA-directed RNA polymerase subunit RPC12/RpoP n=1 Tax=Variovorax ginsengisoli TaxID=363844 RepID=A0ABT9SGF5_9BURK|nr:hypothetical protein [Variovorax ginsengisoli]MDP9902883.1 DNA-directed RNA polymerase subunit RPC12/RpoP [Variovorax ginsengisoli]
MFPSKRLYRCSACGRERLVSERAVNEAVWAAQREKVRNLHPR